jgi:proton-dependent oligopeptide transporter, POT family
MPSQIPFIIGNEAAERFSFYGMRNILTVFLSSTMLLQIVPDKVARELAAKDVFHTFVMGVYFFPLLGGWLADRVFGKYNTILWFSLLYCVGQGVLAFSTDNREVFYLGLGLVALGSGGIKPLVASFVGDQFDARTKHLAKVVFDAFYWSINLGSFFASLLMPYFLRNYHPGIAFGIPGALMLVATLVFWAGRGRYIRVPPAPADPHSFLRISRDAVLGRGFTGELGQLLAIASVVLAMASFLLLRWLDPVPVMCIALVVVFALGGAGVALSLDHARGKHPDDLVDGVGAVLKILIVFSLVTPFWSLFDQKASTWVFQGDQMLKPSWFESSQMQLVNPALVMILIPLNNLVLFPALQKRGWKLTSLGKMTTGIALSGLAWVFAGVIQLVIDSGADVWISWQILPYVFLTMGEVLVSATGLEFAYSQAPKSMKGVIMSFWYLGVTVGGLWVLLANASVKNKSVTEAISSATGLGVNAFLMFFFAVFAFVAAVAFRAYAKRYKMADNYHDSHPAAPAEQAPIPKATARERDDTKR